MRNSNSELLVIEPKTGTQRLPRTVLSVRLFKKGKYSILVEKSHATRRSERLSFMMQIRFTG